MNTITAELNRILNLSRPHGTAEVKITRDVPIQELFVFLYTDLLYPQLLSVGVADEDAEFLLELDYDQPTAADAKNLTILSETVQSHLDETYKAYQAALKPWSRAANNLYAYLLQKAKNSNNNSNNSGKVDKKELALQSEIDKFAIPLAETRAAFLLAEKAERYLRAIRSYDFMGNHQAGAFESREAFDMTDAIRLSFLWDASNPKFNGFGRALSLFA